MANAPPAPMRTDSFRQSRPEIVGEDEPKSPYPVMLAGSVEKGFGRGGKDLGCPTANLSDAALDHLPTDFSTGIYFGYAVVLNSLHSTLSDPDSKVWPMVMSLGWNPYYKNKKMTAEVHVLHAYERDFYGHQMKAILLGYIRPELDYTSREDLIEDIEQDKRVGLNSLNRQHYSKFATHSFLTTAA